MAAGWRADRHGAAQLRLLPLLLAALLAACSPSRAIEAARLLADVGAGDRPSALKANTPAPRRDPIAYRIADRSYLGDLYRPVAGAEAALVLVPGMSPEGRNDPRLVAFATSLARARFTVLVPDIANLRALRVSATDAEAIADAVRYLARRSGDRRGQPIGIAAISYAAGPALIAALAEDVRGRVGFVIAVGGYYDIEALVTFFTTGYFREEPNEPWRHQAPNAYGKWLFVRSNAERMTAHADRAALAEMAERKLADPAAPIDDLVARLGPEGLRVHALLTNEMPDRVPALIAALPDALRAEMAALDLKRRDLSRLQAELILVHGRDDKIIPYTESKALAAAAPDGRATLHLVDSLAHVDLGAGGTTDSMTLWRAAYRLLEARDAAPPPGL